MPLLRSHAPGLSRRVAGEYPGRRAHSGRSEGGLVPMQSALEAFFFALEGAGVPYAILRGGEHITANHARERGLDVDLLTSPKRLAIFEALLTRSLEEFGGRVWERTQIGELVQFHLWAPAPEESPGERHAFFAIDVHTSETCRGVSFLTAQEGMRRKVRSEHLWYAAPAPSATLSFLGPFLAGGHVDERWSKSLRELLSSGSPEARRARWLLARTLGSRRATEIEAALLSHRTEDLEDLSPSARRACMTRSFLRHPLLSVRAALKQVYQSRVRPLWRPRGLFLALLGTDGSGKTTLATELERVLRPLFRGGETIAGHMRPGLLPQLQSLRTGKPAHYRPEEIANPHRAKPSGAIGSWLRASWYTLDFIFGYAFRILPQRRRHVLVLFDRWIDDWLVDSRRARIAPRSRAPRVMQRLAPRPDVLLVCTADPETVRARKQELSEEETVRQLAAYEALADRDPRVRVVQTHHASDPAGQSLPATVDRALDALFQSPRSLR